MCDGGGLCYAEIDAIANYLDLPEIRSLLGVDEFPSNFTSCSRTVGELFASHLDKWRVPNQFYVSELLDRGVRVLIYAGTYDWQCNWVANRLWVDKLEWSGRAEYAEAEWRDWSAGGIKAGETKSAGRLTFATVRGAGHMMSAIMLYWSGSLMTNFSFEIYAPFDKPVETLAMVSRWLAHEDL